MKKYESYFKEEKLKEALTSSAIYNQLYKIVQTILQDAVFTDDNEFEFEKLKKKLLQQYTQQP